MSTLLTTSMVLLSFLLLLVSPNYVRSLPTLCFEQLSTTPAIEMVPHPNGKYAVIGTQSGVMTLVTLPAVNSAVPKSTPVSYNETVMTAVSPWLDLSSRVLFNGERGLLGFAFHPNFRKNGRFFVSYICNATVHPDCAAPCGCDKSTVCRISDCNSTTVIAEYSVPSSSPGSPSNISLPPPSPLSYLSLDSSEKRKILSFGRPYANHNGGHIFFGKRDRYLYYTSGDGGSHGDPWNLAQRGDTFLGKILRLNVDHVDFRGVLRKGNGSYSIPGSNPFLRYKVPAGAPSPVVFPEVFALGLRNPWRCDQDEVTGRIICGDVGQSTMEEADFISAGANYGWHLYEGTLNYSLVSQENPPGGFTSARRMIGRRIQITPLLQYLHSCDSNNVCVKCITGGTIYRAKRNKCLQGKYIFNDLSGPMYISVVYGKKKTPLNTARVPFLCSPDSPIPCSLNSSDVPAKLPMFWSWAKDLGGEAYVMGAPGLFRLVDLNRCGFVGC